MADPYDRAEARAQARAQARSALDAIGQLPDIEIDIAQAALQLARIDLPDADWHAAERQVSALAQDAVDAARGLDSGDVAARAGALAALITGRHRYAGDTSNYADPANANLIQVIERRRGLPVALGILWLHCTRTVGWPGHGLDFPGHFVVALEGNDKARRRGRLNTAVLDVFAGGIPLDASDLRALLQRSEGPAAELRPGVLTPMSTRRVLLRLQNNIRSRRLESGDVQGALDCTLDCLRLAPDHARIWREAAMMHETLQQTEEALRCNERVLELVPEGDLATRARTAMDGLRRRMH